MERKVQRLQGKLDRKKKKRFILTVTLAGWPKEKQTKKSRRNEAYNSSLIPGNSEQINIQYTVYIAPYLNSTPFGRKLSETLSHCLEKDFVAHFPPPPPPFFQPFFRIFILFFILRNTSLQLFFSGSCLYTFILFSGARSLYIYIYTFFSQPSLEQTKQR